MSLPLGSLSPSFPFVSCFCRCRSSCCKVVVAFGSSPLVVPVGMVPVFAHESLCEVTRREIKDGYYYYYLQFLLHHPLLFPASQGFHPMCSLSLSPLTHKYTSRHQFTMCVTVRGKKKNCPSRELFMHLTPRLYFSRRDKRKHFVVKVAGYVCEFLTLINSVYTRKSIFSPSCVCMPVSKHNSLLH